MKKGFVIGGCAALVCGIIGYFTYKKLKTVKAYTEVPMHDPKEDEALAQQEWKVYEGTAEGCEEAPAEDTEEEPEEDSDPEPPIVHDAHAVEYHDIPKEDIPYRITEDEHNSSKLYETETLTYYADGALTDDTDHLVEDILATVGDFKDYFEEEDTDVVYMRNDFLGFDYEIVKDPRKYLDIVKERPYLVGGRLEDDDFEE